MRQNEAIGQLIEDYAARGVFRAAAQPPHPGKEIFRIVWFRGQEMTLELDARAKRVQLADVLPCITPRSRLDRQLREWLRGRTASELPAHRRIDPMQFQLKLSNRAGQMRLGIASASGDLSAATDKLLQLVNELYLDFLAAPERFDWIQEAFDLDPDNPRWP